MKFTKKVIARMPKAYAIGMFNTPDAPGFVVGVEKDGPIRRFALDGTPLETVAEGPGGVMTVTQVPGREDQLLATRAFFSPNFGADEAAIVSYTRAADGTWSERVLCDLPYVHRFGVLRAADGRLWILACTIKGACREVKEDWSRPGAVYAAPLDALPEGAGADDRLPMELVAGCQLQNHVFWVAPDRSFALVSTAAGVFRYTPPAAPGAAWDVRCLIVHPTSDVCMGDFDGDGADEILTISAFHGDTLRVWHTGEHEDFYTPVWTDTTSRAFLHAIWSGELSGATCAVVGNRKGGRDLLRVWYDADAGNYRIEEIDHDCGPANCWVFSADGTDHIIAANRETDEVAFYDVVEN